MRLKLIQVFQQHQNVLAARGEICRACGGLAAQSLKFGKYVGISPISPDRRLRWQGVQQPLYDRLGQESVPKHPD
jgi:hypothetical protein